MNKSIDFNFTCISLQLTASQVHKLTRDVLTERMKDIIEIVKLFCIQCQHAKKNAEIPISQIATLMSIHFSCTFADFSTYINGWIFSGYADKRMKIDPNFMLTWYMMV